MNTVTSSLSVEPVAPVLRPWLARVGAAVLGALEDSGRRRAQRHILEFASHCQAQQPELAKELRAAARQGPIA